MKKRSIISWCMAVAVIVAAMSLGGCGEKDTIVETDVQPAEVETANSNLNAEFKAAMDSYESFMDEYVEFMEKYKKDPTDLSLIKEYTNVMKEYAEVTKTFGEWQSADMSTDELSYYIDVQARVNKKLLEVAE